MKKYKYTGPTILIGEHDEFELRKGMEVLAEVNVNIAKVKVYLRMPLCLNPKEIEVDIAAKYLEPVKPEPIHFDPKGDVRLDNFFDKLFEQIGKINTKHGFRSFFDCTDEFKKMLDEQWAEKYGEPSEEALDILHGMARERNDNGHEVGGTHYIMAIEPWDYTSIVQELTDTYKAKNHDYGNSFTELFSECGMTYAYGHLKEKINRIKSLMSEEAKVKDEKMEDSLKDLANYAILTIMELRKEKKC